MLHKESLQFLSELKENNHKEWFHGQKKRYENYKADYHQLIRDLLQYLKQYDPNLELLEVKNCTFRINRDIRFSKDKSPYKTHLSIWMSTMPNTKNGPGYYVHIDPNECFIAGGVYCPEADVLKKIRNEIAFFQEDLEQIIKEEKFNSIFENLDFDEKLMLKTAPKGFEKDHPAVTFLKLKSFTATHKIDFKTVTKPEFVAEIGKKLLALKPLNDFIKRAIETEA
uniref:DUF2461 domain-containing protein n=1 Tax=Flavobacterium sp. TaxID=239 RepID=UPI00404B9964